MNTESSSTVDGDESARQAFRKIRGQSSPNEIVKTYEQSAKTSDKNKALDAFRKFEAKESWGKSLVRTLAQIPKGISQALTYPADILNMIATGSALDAGDLQDLRWAAEREGVPFDEEAYVEAVGRIHDHFPTVGNISREVESATGLPLEAKTPFQKFVNFASAASTIAPKGATFRGMNTSLPRPVLGTGVAATAETAKALGVNETVADIASFAVLKTPSAGAGSISIGKEKGPSGLTKRHYEGLKEPRKVSPSKINQINQKVEGEFRGIADRIIKDTPINDTRSAIKAGPAFKEAASEAFKEVEAISERLTKPLTSSKVTESMKARTSKKTGTGFAPSEVDKTYQQVIKDLIHETPKDTKILAKDLVVQYRKNNKELGEIWEPGKSRAYNMGKKDALLDYNRSIADVIENEFPGTELAKPFKAANEKWAQIMDAEAIEKFMDDLFTGKVQFQKGRDFFEKQGMKQTFTRALGKEGYGNFSQLMNDLMSTEQGSKLLRAARSSGYKDLAEMAGSYILHPKLSPVVAGIKVAKKGWNGIVNMMLDKPKLAVQWKKGIIAMKAHDFKAAETIFKKIEDEMRSIEPSIDPHRS